MWNEFFTNRDWPLAAAAAAVLLLLLVPPSVWLQRSQAGRGLQAMIRRRFSWPGLALILGLGFLYVPLVLVIIYSFNESRLVTVWTGFSARWYGETFWPMINY